MLIKIKENKINEIKTCTAKNQSSKTLLTDYIVELKADLIPSKFLSSLTIPFNILFYYSNCLFLLSNSSILLFIGSNCSTAFLFFYCDNFALSLFRRTHWHFLQSQH